MARLEATAGGPQLATARARALQPKPLFDEDLVLAALEAQKIPVQHAFTVWRNILRNGAHSWREIRDLPNALRMVLDRDFVLLTSRVIRADHSTDGSTTKLLVELQDGHRIESVIMRYGAVQLADFPSEMQRAVPPDTSQTRGSGMDAAPLRVDPAEPQRRESVDSHETVTTYRSNRRATLCISSQVGCSMGCTFCATGTMGLLANLTPGEMLEQLYHANQFEPIRNVVFMVSHGRPR